LEGFRATFSVVGRKMGGSSSKKKHAGASQGVNNNHLKRQAAQSQVSSKDRAILDLKNARDRLKKYQTRLDTEAQVLHESARKLLQVDKRVSPTYIMMHLFMHLY
jgi:division protein CdvB (Snf7/Vps24/ESCRT-III family)